LMPNSNAVLTISDVCSNKNKYDEQSNNTRTCYKIYPVRFDRLNEIV
jgi:hypothetical protein